jgi:hypothetical protein
MDRIDKNMVVMAVKNSISDIGFCGIQIHSDKIAEIYQAVRENGQVLDWDYLSAVEELARAGLWPSLQNVLARTCWMELG